jgi:periplasmic protein TonB
MKTKKNLSAFFWLMVFLSFIGCSKNEIITPTQGQTSSNKKDLPELVDSRATFAMLNQQPSFRGGDSLFIDYLVNHVNYPGDAVKNNVSGSVFISFIVEKDGSISNVEKLRGIGYGCDEEAINAVKNMPPWIPGKINNSSVRVKLVIPIAFKNR